MSYDLCSESGMGVSKLLHRSELRLVDCSPVDLLPSSVHQDQSC